MGVPVVIGGDNLPSPVPIGLNDLKNIGGASGPPGPPGSGTNEESSISHQGSSHQAVVKIFVKKFVKPKGTSRNLKILPFLSMTSNLAGQSQFLEASLVRKQMASLKIQLDRKYVHGKMNST